MEFSWFVLPHQPYSPDLVPNNYCLFLSLQNPLMGNIFSCIFMSEKHFPTPNVSNYTNVFDELPDKWQQDTANNSQYIIE